MDDPESIDKQWDGLACSIGTDEAEVMWAGVGVMLHALVIKDWRRVYKGLWIVCETLRRISGEDLPEYFTPSGNASSGTDALRSATEAEATMGTTKSESPSLRSDGVSEATQDAKES